MFRLGTVASSGEGRATINLVISADTNNYDISSNRGGGYVAGETDVTLTINSGVSVGSTSTGTYALETGSSWATGDTITIVNNGTVKGCGGKGGDGGDGDYSSSFSGVGEDGGNGGNAFRAQFLCSFTNNGSVYGGGGGGGGQGGSYFDITLKGVTTTYAYGGDGGGGGAGVNAGAGGIGGTGTNADELYQGIDGNPGTATAGGLGGTANAGAGGGLGTDGGDGQVAAGNRAAGGVGGIRGFYQVGSSLINSGSGIGGVIGGRSS
jgi:hypothetical protein